MPDNSCAAPTGLGVNFLRLPRSYDRGYVCDALRAQRAQLERSINPICALEQVQTAHGRGLIKLSWELKSLRENPCRPYGARVNFPLYPALKRWAKLFRAYGAQRSGHVDRRGGWIP